MSRALRAPLLCVGAPFFFCALVACAARPEPLSVLAPLFGPFAGSLLGHSDCTLATVAPMWSAVGALVLIAALLASARLHASPYATRRRMSHAALALAALHWSLLAVLSIANTLS